MCKPPIYSLIAREEQFIYEALNIVEEEKNAVDNHHYGSQHNQASFNSEIFGE